MQHGELDFFGQPGKETLDIDLAGMPALGFEEQLVAFLVGEAHHFLLKAGAVAWTGGVDSPWSDGRAVEVVAHDLQCIRRGVDGVTG